MSTELLYTSAPQGLRHGSKGFCTVLTTAGMPINVIARLESISSYRHLCRTGSAPAADNPIALSHQRLNLGGQTVSVISRIAPYGTDYSRRDNKLAHHVTVDPSEMPAAGPAWLIRDGSVLRTEWLGQCETPATGPEIPQGDQSPRICTTWKSIAGDAGWGGVVAEAVASGGGNPLWVIYDLNQQHQLLELIDESISLLPASQRWQATFSTFAANIPPDVQCKIRFVPSGTEEARFAASNSKAIDLTKSQSITTASQWVERARGVVRNAPVAKASGGSFNAVQETADTTEVESSWSGLEEPTGPPPDPTPPALPPNLDRPSDSRRQLLIAGVVLGGIFTLVSTWAVARMMAGLPILPGQEIPIEPPARVPVVTKKEKPTVKPPAVEVAKVVQNISVRYDQNQLVDWAIGATSDQSPLPKAIRLQGRHRVQIHRRDGESERSDSAQDDAAQNAAGAASPDQGTRANPPELKPVGALARLISWGGENQSLGEPEDFVFSTPELSDNRQSFSVQPIPYSPDDLVATRLYWSRETDDLLAVTELDSSAVPERLADQLRAYRTLGRMLHETAGRIDSVRQSSKQLPQTFQNAVAPFLVRSRRTPEATTRALFRSAANAEELSESAMALSETLRGKLAGSSKALNKDQQDALLRVVSDCERIAQFSGDLRRAHETLQRGWIIETPDLKFLDSEGRVLRQLPVRFHFSL